ncbi:hypothetical protein L3Y34_005884 [Caenorhabditis briggsae]|uniref:CUB-like domain-containing protein n=2 Tax=Caenorhabditis briggsae TaxID=6238 RepID=A0AAE8ZV68_CAEBR|nr:hypothetical protein L3Y34_005884 [Caenorhabditis briggsae]
MLKLVAVYLVVTCSYALDFACPTSTITAATLSGTVPAGASNLTNVLMGTNCTIKFDIPNNYVLLMKLSSQAGSDQDTVIIFDNNNVHKYNLLHSSAPIYNVPLWMPAKSAMVQVYGDSGISKLYLSYNYISLAGYKQSLVKNTGEYFPLNTITANNYVTITTSSPNEQVVATPASSVGMSDPGLLYYLVYDGDNINTASFLGTLSDLEQRITIASGKSVSIVNLSGVNSDSYVLGNDASSLNGFSRYSVLTIPPGNGIRGNLSDLTDSPRGSAYTFICLNCTTFHWTSLVFDSMSTIANKGSVTFQGQTPTQKRDQLIKYDPMTLTNSYFPQMIPSDCFTMIMYLSKFSVTLNTVQDYAPWKQPFDGRKGYIFSPSLWSSAANNFNYEFRNDTQQYFYTLNMNKMSLPNNEDQMTLKIGSGTGNPTVNNQYPRDQSSNQQVVAQGNYMQVGLPASAAADVRLSFAMDLNQTTAAPSTTSTTPTTASTTVQTTTSGGFPISYNILLLGFTLIIVA